MLIKQIKKQQGNALGVIMPFVILLFIFATLIGITIKNALKPDKEDVDSLLLLSNQLQYSHSNSNIILTYNDIISFQQKLLKTSKPLITQCSAIPCELFKIEDYPHNTYMTLFYNNGNLTSFEIISNPEKTMFTLFKYHPFSGWDSLSEVSSFDLLKIPVYALLKNTKTTINADGAFVYSYTVPATYVYYKDDSHVN